ncbi:uncharacterized protein MONOS_12334 [Monocercomonoides exilis]|uniref:uncharacterized protein n=1 Tax=Monocercomonoides exilis TaxID=2049356 RepID=UPI00355A8A8A|nr:hypothetical protein MONOS_12334 [Monocercomonoides exilis]|eukprot:MONOS_12334.1-p1 / transcript=MONOS_12334.1 / gene=MONOS_12334 / organism=Monocercomonoides_exilis_PA203 / gene_product=unspecified product / transcript_product=unspecified product / location=Mono_scaffold00677:26478-33155(-) / protein_length=2171 / sequence_SO=supercontig / SO=protein_coding / is_pseudo=false
MRYLIVTICALIYNINGYHGHQLATVDHSPGSNIVFYDKNCDMNEYMDMKNVCSFDNEELLKNGENNENLDEVKDIKQNPQKYSKPFFSFKDLGRISEQSQIIGNMRLINSSVELKGIELMGCECGSVVYGRKGSVVVVRGCVVGMGKDDGAGAFDLSGSIGVLTNITLKGWRRGGEIYSGRLFGGKGYGREKSEGEEKGGEGGESGRGRGREGEGDGYGEGIEGSISVSESHFSSFCVSSAPFLSSPSIPLISLSKLTFFNISTANDVCSPSTTTSSQTSCLMSSCSFSSVCNAYDGGIVPSLNNPLASLTVSNSSFVRCYRTRNVEFIGTEMKKKQPGRQNSTENGQNTFIWCEWNGSKTSGIVQDGSDSASNGGAIYMFNLQSGEMSISHCTFNDCYAYYCGGGIMCLAIKSIHIENNVFNACTAQNEYGGGICVYGVSTCVKISECKFRNCEAYNEGGGSSCVGEEKGGGESACVFDCSFVFCSVANNGGGGMLCYNIHSIQFKMRSAQFISCSALSEGGGFCRSEATPYGHDMMYGDDFNLFLSSGNPFFECYTLNTDDQRVCYANNPSGSWIFDQTSKKDWLKRGILNRFVAVSGGGEDDLCGLDESTACRTIGVAVIRSVIQVSLSVMLLEGSHISETTTIEIGTKKISVIGKGKDKSLIEMKSLSSTGPLFSVSTGHLGMSHLKVDCNTEAETSPSVVVVSDRSGSLSLEDVVITTSETGNFVIPSSVLVVPLLQLSMVDVEIINMNVSKPLFSEPNQSPSSSSSSLSSSALYLTATASGDSVLANVKVMNVKLTEGDGVVVAKSVKAGETFVVKNVTIEDCECKAGSGGGIKVDLLSPSSKLRAGTTTTFNRCTSGRFGGGMMLYLANNSIDFSIVSVDFSGCSALLGGNSLLISGWDLSEIVDKEHFKWKMSSEELESLDSLCGWERKTTGEGYVIPLVVYLWRNWSRDGFVSRDKGGDFSGCGYSEAPCSSIDHLISLRCPTLGEGETHIAIVGSGLLRHSISFSFLSFSSSILEKPKVAIEGTKKGTGVTISDEDENDLKDSMISSNVSLSLVNMSFTKPVAKTNHAVFIESSGTNAFLTVTDCSFGALAGLTEAFAYCAIKVNGGSALIEKCTMNLISDLKGFISLSKSVDQVIVQKVNISLTTVTERSLISIFEDELTNEVSVSSGLNAAENGHPKNSMPLLKVNGCSFANITKEGNGAGVIDVGSFDYAVECILDECAMTSCKSASSTEGGGMKVVLKSEETVFKINDSSFSTCKCSSDTGRGGGLFINGAEDDVNYEGDAKIPSLNFNIVDIMFYSNEAHEGNDIFIKCYSIAKQINETLFTLNYNQESLNSDNSICGCDSKGNANMDLIPLITFYYSAQVFVSGRGSDGRGCGAQTNPCSSINCGIEHIQEGVMNAILIDGEGFVTEECVIGDLVVNSLKKTRGVVRLNSKIEKSGEKDCVMEFVNECSVEKCSFEFEDTFKATHNHFMKVKNGSTEIHKCEFCSSATAVGMRLNSSVVSVESGELKISETTFKDLESAGSVLLFNKESNVTLLETSILNIKCEGNVVSVGRKAKVVMKEMTFENVTLLLKGCAIEMEDAEQEVSVLNSSFGRCVNSVDKGNMIQVRQCKEVNVENCVFDGEKEAKAVNEGNKGKEGLCKWSGSLIDIENSNVEMKETTIRASKAGGLWVSGGSMKIENSKFDINNPEIEGYGSARRNAICTGNCELNVVSVKGGDGMFPNTSLWILDEGCQLRGIASERGSSYFIPVLEEVKNTTQPTGEMELIIHGKLLLPCNLSLEISMKDGNEEEIVRKEINGEGYISENEVHSVVSSEQLEAMEKKTEVSVRILFGNTGSSSSTDSFILKNKSETEPKGDERISEGEGKIEWSLIAFIGCVIVLLIFIALFVVVVVLMRKKQNRGGRKVEDGDIEESKNVGRGEWRKEDIAQRVEEEDKVQVLLDEETGNEIGILSEKCKELHPYENKEIIENKFDQEEVVEVVPVNYVEIQTIASLLNSEKDGGMENGACIGGKEDENVRKSDRKAKRGKRRKGKKRKQVEEIDEIGDERAGSEIGLDELGGVSTDDGRNGKQTEYYIGICSAPNSHFSMIGDDSEEKSVNEVLDEEKEVLKEGKEEEGIGEEKQKRRKKKKKKNQKGEDKSEIVRDIAEMGLLDAG